MASEYPSTQTQQIKNMQQTGNQKPKVVGRRTEILEIGKWGTQRPRSQIVAIGASDGINSAELTKKFDRCLAMIEKT